MKLTLEEIAAILGTTSGAPDRLATGYSIDSRNLVPGQLFFAIKGPHFDGHEFVAQALERGATGAVVSKAYREKASGAAAAALLAVPDPVRALQDLARAVRRKWGRRIVAITGSTGKTTTKELIAAILSRRFSVLKTAGNLNNYYGLPLTLLQLEPSHEVAVAELAMSAPGEIAMLAQISEPQMGVVTNVAPVHLQFFDSVEAIANAKHELIENLVPPGIAILNSDDERVRNFALGFGGKVVTYGFANGASVRVLDWRATPEMGNRFRVRAPGFEHEFEIPLVGRHNAQNALAAIAVASVFEIAPEQIAEALAVRPDLHQRSEVFTLPGEITVLNDSYNSNPVAMERMLETLAAWPHASRRILVAGEMLELGTQATELHREVGRKCVASGVDWLIAVQGAARFFVEGAVEAGLPADHAALCRTPEEAGERLLVLLRPGDVVMVKGSRGVHLEKVIELLRTLGDAPAAEENLKRSS
jgi:UDP-N-acetylmuramoyl-tripeptide--D-alanyl-D-alanine ligase